MSKVDREAHKTLAIELRAMGCMMNDQCQTNTNTGSKLIHAADLLERAARNMCNMGMPGCRGDNCNSDSHK